MKYGHFWIINKHRTANFQFEQEQNPTLWLRLKAYDLRKVILILVVKPPVDFYIISEILIALSWMERIYVLYIPPLQYCIL